MIRDANKSDVTFNDEYDVCIIGAGPAGITLALKLARFGFRVVLLEGGDRDFTGESQELYQGEILGKWYHGLDVSRLRYLGGTTGHWGGQCLKLEKPDFEPREDVELSGWPIRFDDLEPYEDEANKVLNLMTFGPLRRPLDENLEVVTQRWSADRTFYDVSNNEPMRFGSTFVDDLEESENIDLALNANVTRMDVDTASGRVTSAHVESFGGQEHDVKARQFVFAMGAVENARSLLHLNRDHGNRFGNQGDMVGRCFMEHPIVINGACFITRRLYSNSRHWGLERLIRRQRPEQAISLTADYQRKAGILNATVRINRLRQRALKGNETQENPFVESLNYNEDYFFVSDSYSISEQAPNRASRLLLTDSKDRYGLSKIGFDWQLLPIDLESLREVTVEVAKMFIRTGLGRMQVHPNLWERSEDIEYEAYGHHMGGVRMSENSDTGVVDANCKVHGAENLYVAGSGVFSTSGHANPTYTIVQLSLRLADHLKAIG